MARFKNAHRQHKRELHHRNAFILAARRGREAGHARQQLLQQRGGGPDYDFNPKTNEFLVLSSGSQQQYLIVVVTNWFEELKARLAQPSKP